jgi:hypothetical protein
LSGTRCLFRLAWLATLLEACAPERYVPREPGLEVFREEASVRLKEREGDQAKETATRYAVDLESREKRPSIERASTGASVTRCAPDEAPLATDLEKPLWGDERYGTFGVTVPARTRTPALDLFITADAGSSTCVRVPVEGDEIAWRRVHPAWGMATAYAGVIPVTRVGSTSGSQMFEVKAMEWWGIVRGTAFVGGGAAYCAAAPCGGQPDGATPDGGPQLLHGVFGVVSAILGGSQFRRLHGEPVRPGLAAFPAAISPWQAVLASSSYPPPCPRSPPEAINRPEADALAVPSASLGHARQPEATAPRGVIDVLAPDAVGRPVQLQREESAAFSCGSPSS